MTNPALRLLAAVVVLLGIGLMIAGIATDKDGAVVVGIVVAGVAAQRMIAIAGQNRARGRQKRR